MLQKMANNKYDLKKSEFPNMTKHKHRLFKVKKQTLLMQT